MRAARLLALLALLWAGLPTAQAGFKLKLTPLSDLEPVVSGARGQGDALVAPPAHPYVLACFDPSGLRRDDLAGSVGLGSPVLTFGPDRPSDLTLLPAAGPTTPAGAALAADVPVVPSGGRGPDSSGASGGGAPVGSLGGSGPETASAPAPPSLVLAGIGAAGLIGYSWRRRAARPG